MAMLRLKRPSYFQSVFEQHFVNSCLMAKQRLSGTSKQALPMERVGKAQLQNVPINYRSKRGGLRTLSEICDDHVCKTKITS